MYDFPLLISQQGPLGTPTPQSSPDTPGQIWITGTIFHFSFLNRAPSGLPLRKAPLIRLDHRYDFPLLISQQGPLGTPTPQSSPDTPGPQCNPSEPICLSFWQPCPLARSYDEVCHAGLADPKCLGELLLGKGKSKLNL